MLSALQAFIGPELFILFLAACAVSFVWSLFHVWNAHKEPPTQG